MSRFTDTLQCFIPRHELVFLRLIFCRSVNPRGQIAAAHDEVKCMRSKWSLPVAPVSLLSTRRDVLRGGTAAIAAAVAGSLSPWRAFAQTTSGSFDYYISPTGSDSNAGTSASPWALTAINTKRSTYAGKRVGVLPGTYNCLSLVGGSYRGDFATPAFNIAGGSSGSPTVIQSTTPRGAVLDASANSSNNPNGQPLIGTIGPTAGAGYITLDGFEIKNCYNRAISAGQDTGASFSGTRVLGLVIQNCFVHDVTNNIGAANPTAITMYSSQGAVIQNNYITNMYDNYSRASGIEIWTSIGTVTQFNSVISNSTQQSGGILHKNSSQHSNTLRYNFVDMTKSGSGGTYGVIVDDDGDGSTTDSIYNNVIVADAPVQASAMDVGNFPSSANHQVWYNNTFVGIPNCSVGCWVRFGAAGTIKFYNNIISRGTIGGRGDADTSASAFALVDYNCYPASPSLGLSPNGSQNYPNSVTSNLASWASTLPSGAIGKDAHSVAASPMFVGTGNGAARYKLQSGSPCSGKGSTNGTSGGSATDMGAWGNGASQVGCNFAPGSVVPDAPVLTVS